MLIARIEAQSGLPRETKPATPRDMVPLVSGSLVQLRPLERSDLERCRRWVTDPELTEFLLAGRRPITASREEDWYNRIHSSEHDVVLAIVKREDGAHIGNCGLHAIDHVDRSATLGITIGEKDCWGRGFGSQAVALTLSYGFDVLNLHRVELGVFETNARGIKAYEKVGFKHEGRKRKARFKNGRYLDELSMAVLRDEWQRPSM
jgi:RimJ/RimL family protein N-acetyltransferase